MRDLKTYIYERKLENTISYKGENFLVKDLQEKITKITPGIKLGYITDLVFAKKNLKKIRKIAKDISILYIESTFLNKDHLRAKERFHLTARQAGYIAKILNAKKVYPIHISPINMGKYQIVKRELINEWKRGAN